MIQVTEFMLATFLEINLDQIADALKCKHNSRKILISLCDAILNQTHARAMVRAHTLDVRRTHGLPHCT